MPKKFVTRLREIRRLQKQRENEQNNRLLQSNQTANMNQARQAFGNTAIDDWVDELS